MTSGIGALLRRNRRVTFYRNSAFVPHLDEKRKPISIPVPNPIQKLEILVSSKTKRQNMLKLLSLHFGTFLVTPYLRQGVFPFWNWVWFVV